MPPEKAAVSEETVSADIFRLLRSDIISGTLQPGARLRFIELQARYDIGTSPLREALSRLAADRLVIQEVNRGFSVPPISLEDFADIARLRSALERGAIEASIARGDETWEEQVVLAHHRLRRLGRQESDPQDEAIPEEWERRHRAFHTALIAACGSPWTLHFCGVLYDQFDRYRRRVGRDAAIQAGLSAPARSARRSGHRARRGSCRRNPRGSYQHHHQDRLEAVAERRLNGACREYLGVAGFSSPIYDEMPIFDNRIVC